MCETPGRVVEWSLKKRREVCGVRGSGTGCRRRGRQGLGYVGLLDHVDGFGFSPKKSSEQSLKNSEGDEGIGMPRFVCISPAK